MDYRNIIKDYRLDTIAMLVSLHYRLLKNKVEERKATGKVELLSKQEAETADYLCDVIETVAGKNLANYCRDRFTTGWMTGDLRSYKIKLVLTRLRDRMKPDAVKEELLSRFGSLVDTAEFLAGCKADGKRRNKKAIEEQKARKAERAARRAAKKRTSKEQNTADSFQLEFDLPGFESSDSPSCPDSSEASKVVKSEVKQLKPRKTRKPRRSRKNSIDNLAEDIIKQEYKDGYTSDEFKDDTYRQSYDEDYSYGLGQGFGHYDSTGYNWNSNDEF